MSFYAIVVEYHQSPFPFSCAVERGVMDTHGGGGTSSVSGSDENEMDPGYQE